MRSQLIDFQTTYITSQRVWCESIGLHYTGSSLQSLAQVTSEKFIVSCMVHHVRECTLRYKLVLTWMLFCENESH